MARRRRGLSPEDEELWARIARQAVPLRPDPPLAEQTQAKSPDAAPPDEPRAPPEPRIAPAPFRLGEAADHRRGHDLLAPLADRLARPAPGMDRRLLREMQRGRLLPEARLDLHGMTLAEAHPALVRFVLASQGRGLRLVLVITGKGKPAPDDGPIPVRPGALRHQVPHWLALPPVGPGVLQVAPAHLRHGGGGAYYVYLRRPR